MMLSLILNYNVYHITKIMKRIINELYYGIILISIVACTDNQSPQKQELIPNIDFVVNYKLPDDNDLKKQSKGHFTDKKETIGIVDNNDTIAIVELSAPSIVAIADKDYPWGWFQFPTMGVNKDGLISVEWQMKNDAIDDYSDSAGLNNKKVSFDNGLTWISPPNNMYIPAFRESVQMNNGDILSISTQTTEKISEIKDFPLPSYTFGDYEFFYERDLPDKFKGIYINYFHKDSKDTFHATVKNDSLIRYSVKGMMSTFWFGKLMRYGSDLYACIYPSFYADINGHLEPMTVSFYKSSDSGRTWNIQGHIDYKINELYHPLLDFIKRCFTEPTFEFLKDGRLICIMRTSEGSVTPMYKSYSKDFGVTWSTPEPITPNGVMPQLIRLDNDIIVLASGRPGIQLRFSCDGMGEKWSSPIELIDYDETQSWVNDTCGYPFLFRASENEVYIVYSNFKSKDQDGNYRKSIIFRKLNIYKY